MSGLAVRGVVEGFYGRPWSWEDRHRMLELLAEHGGNTYLYAPKNDPLHRDRWREPYLPEEWASFTGLAEAGSRLGVDVWFGISPLGIRLTDEHDLARLEAKLAAADEAGLRRICLLVDDMPEDHASSRDAAAFATLADAHVHLVGTVRSMLRDRGGDRHLWFVPLHYHGDPDQDHVRRLGSGIDPDVAIMWTGPEVCSEHLTLEHTRAVAASLRRPVLYWDNHPVNDGGMRHDPHLNPLQGRDTRLGPETMGLLANVAIQPEASAIAVITAMRYAADPARYDAADAWEQALLTVAGDDAQARAVATLADLARRSPIQRGDPLGNHLAEPLERCTRAWDDPKGDRRATLSALAPVLDALVGTADQLLSLDNERLRRDLEPWSRKLGWQSSAATKALEVLTAALDGKASASGDRRAVFDLLERSRATFHWVAGDQLEVFSRWCLHRADELSVTRQQEEEP